MSARLPTVASVAGLTHAGRVRSTNEDSFRVSEIGGPLARGPEEVVARLALPDGLVLGVYDGAGGLGGEHAAGEAAARVVGETLSRCAVPSGQAELSARLVEAVTAASDAICADARANPSRRGMGTTATVAVVAGEHLVVAQVGDSRAYLLRGRELVQLTRDDTLLQEALRSGSLSPSDVSGFPYKNVLLQVLGNGADLQVAISTVEARHGDVVLLCTDGVHGLLDDRRMRAILLRHRAPGPSARVLLDEALRAGGHDNMALVVARLDGGELSAGAAPGG